MFIRKIMLILPHIEFTRNFAIYSVQNLAQVDYTVANRVSEDVAEVVRWSYDHDYVWLANLAIDILQTLDNFGSILISLVVIIIHNTR